MKKFTMSAIVLSGLIGGLAATPAVLAQTAAPGAAQTQPQAHHHRLPSERLDARLAYLKTALKITPAQEPQWNALADVMRKQAHDMDARMEQRHAQPQPGAQSATAIDRLQQRQQFLSDAAARTSDLLNVAKPLYASFTPDQKKIADEMLSGGHRHGHGHGRWN